MFKPVISLSIGILALATSAYAQDCTFAFVNYAEIEKESSVAKNLESQIKAQQKSLEGQAKSAQKSLGAKAEELEKTMKMLSKEAAVAKQQEFQNDAMKLEEKLKKRATELEEKKNQALAVVNSKIAAVASEIVEKRGFQGAFPAASAITYPKTCDITPEVIKELNEKMPKHSVNWGKNS